MDQRSIVMMGGGILGLVALAAIYFGLDWIEQDLTARTRSALAGAELHWAKVSFSGRRATLAGTAPSAEARAQARALVESVWGVAGVRDELALDQAGRAMEQRPWAT